MQDRITMFYLGEEGIVHCVIHPSHKKAFESIGFADHEDGLIDVLKKDNAELEEVKKQLEERTRELEELNQRIDAAQKPKAKRGRKNDNSSNAN